MKFEYFTAYFNILILLKVGSAEETEVVSEDELPEVQKPSIKDAENVSDDELPGPKPAELPADTEVIILHSQNFPTVFVYMIIRHKIKNDKYII